MALLSNNVLKISLFSVILLELLTKWRYSKWMAISRDTSSVKSQKCFVEQRQLS